MPAFKDLLNDADLAAIINHERTSWGNAAPTVSASEVAKLRDDVAEAVRPPGSGGQDTRK